MYSAAPIQGFLNLPPRAQGILLLLLNHLKIFIFTKYLLHHSFFSYHLLLKLGFEKNKVKLSLSGISCKEHENSTTTVKKLVKN